MVKETSIKLNRPNVVGTIHTPGGFDAAVLGIVDVVEVRVDQLPAGLSSDTLKSLNIPAILTVRRADEGGGRVYSDEERISLYLSLMEDVAAIDVEGRSLSEMEGVIRRAREIGKRVIVSFHDFSATPSADELRQILSVGRAGGADIVKIAAVTETAADIVRLLSLLDRPEGPVSVMGMGTLGRASRLLFAKAGSVLNYGWLDQPQVPGQWSAPEFAELLRRA